MKYFVICILLSGCAFTGGFEVVNPDTFVTCTDSRNDFSFTFNTDNIFLINWGMPDVSEIGVITTENDTLFLASKDDCFLTCEQGVK